MFDFNIIYFDKRPCHTAHLFCNKKFFNFKKAENVTLIMNTFFFMGQLNKGGDINFI